LAQEVGDNLKKDEDESNVISLSFKKTEREQKLKQYVKGKTGYSAWVKEAMFEKMEKEESQKNQTQIKTLDMGCVKFDDSFSIL